MEKGIDAGAPRMNGLRNAMERTGTHTSHGSIRKRNLKGKASTAGIGFNGL